MIVYPLTNYNENVVIIDYGMSNLQSVKNALESLGCYAVVSGEAAVVETADRLILPGVGAFGHGMKHLRERGLVESMQEFVNSGRPILGICLGMQLLADESFEHGHHEGLHFIPGSVRRLTQVEGLRIPHMGWNNVTLHGECPIYNEVNSGSDFYFVHSYHFIPENESDVSAWCEYGMYFAASVSRGKVFGAQFHPEKSHRAGLTMLRNFLTC